MEKYFKLGATKDLSETLEAHPDGARPFITEGLHELIDLKAEEGHAKRGRLKKPAYANPRMKIAGFGGQGILLLGVSLAECGMQAGFEVSWLPSYGPEMRGGTANCHTRISDTEIGSPLVAESDVLIAMNRPSLEKFEKDIRPGGLLTYDSSLITISPSRKDVEIVAIPATQLADEIGSTKIANMVAMGAYLEKTGIMDLSSVIEALPSYIKAKKTIALNAQAIEKGAKFVREMP
jgi:Pyruvate/2-oxoacid:ferredoxin oxidoreductase gamma subunit